MNNGLNSIEDIDAMLDKDFNIEEDVNNEDTNGDENSQELENENDTSTNVEDESSSDDEDNQDDEQGSDNGTTNQNDETDEKTKKDDGSKKGVDTQKEYAFAQLRKENADLKSKYKTSSQSEAMLKNIAAQYGYNDVDKFIKDYNDASVIKEAKEKGYDPVLYKDLQESKKRIEQLESENRQSKLMEKAGKFKDAVEKAVVTYNLGENGRNEIFTKLEEAGFNVDTILSLPNPEIVIKGILSDKIAEVSKQKQIDKLETLDNLVDERHDGSSSTKTLSVDDLIAQEMKEYKKANYL